MNLPIAIAACAITSCGLVNGLGGDKGEPSNARLTQLSWHGPVQVPKGGADYADTPNMTWAQGAAWLAFTAFDLGTHTNSTWLTRRARGGDFVTPVQILQESGSNGWDGGAAYPVVLGGLEGDIAVLGIEWQVNDQSIVTSSSLWSQHFDAQLTATDPGEMLPFSNTSGGLDFSTGTSGIDDHGDLAATYFEDGIGVVVDTQPAGENWRTPAGIGSSQPYGTSMLSAGATGAGFLVWSNVSSDQSGSHYAPVGVTVDPSSFTPGVTGGQSFGSLTNMQMVSAMRGNHGMALFSSSEGGLDGWPYENGFFTSGTALPTQELPYYVLPEVAVDSRGDAVAVWRENAAQNDDAYGGSLRASYWDGGSWSPGQQLDVGAPYPHVWWEQVAMNDNGEAVAAWADFDPTGKFNRIYANVLDVSSGVKWSGAVPIDQASPDAGLADQPQNVRWISVSLDRDGGAAQVTWMQHAGDANSTPQVWANWIGE